MKKLIVIATAIFVLGILTVFCDHPSFPLRGNIHAVNVTRDDWGEKKSVRIEDPNRIRSIETSLRLVWSSFIPGNAMEGYPRYDMTVEYADGTTQRFHFDRTDWGANGRTPGSLVMELDKSF